MRIAERHGREAGAARGVMCARTDRGRFIPPTPVVRSYASWPRGNNSSDRFDDGHHPRRRCRFPSHTDKHRFRTDPPPDAPQGPFRVRVSFDEQVRGWRTRPRTARRRRGAHYTATSGTLTFAPGETTKTIPVPVLDDSHDDDGETLRLTLSNPTGAYIADGTATGTIHNSDAMPKAWIARFGRTVTCNPVPTVTKAKVGAAYEVQATTRRYASANSAATPRCACRAVSTPPTRKAASSTRLRSDDRASRHRPTCRAGRGGSRQRRRWCSCLSDLGPHDDAEFGLKGDHGRFQIRCENCG